MDVGNKWQHQTYRHAAGGLPIDRPFQFPAAHRDSIKSHRGDSVITVRFFDILSTQSRQGTQQSARCRCTHVARQHTPPMASGARTFHSAGVSFRHIGHGVPGSRPPSRDKVQGSSCRPDSVRSFNQIFPPSRPSSKHRALSIIQLLIHSAIFSAKFSSNKFIKFHIILK